MHFTGPAWKAQHTNMLDKIRESGNPQQAATMNSSGLTEAAVEFVKQQTPFVHKVHISAAAFGLYTQKSTVHGGFLNKTRAEEVPEDV